MKSIIRISFVITALAMIFQPTLLWAKNTPVFVTGQWLEKKLQDKQTVVIDMSDETQYERFHIPGAMSVSYHYLIAPRKKKDKFSKRISDVFFVRLMGKLGIKRNHYIVIYDDMGGLNAGRLFWHLERIGHPKVSVLDGGLVRWILDGRKVENKPHRRKPLAYGKSTRGRDNEVLLSDVKTISKVGNTSLLDVRTKDEYLGDLKKKKGGHIPGALWWPWQYSVDFPKGFVTKNSKVLVKDLVAIGAGDKKRPIVTYCRSGHRAAQSYLILRSLGYQNVKLFVNSMAEYGSHRSNPLVLGKKPK